METSHGSEQMSMREVHCYLRRLENLCGQPCPAPQQFPLACQRPGIQLLLHPPRPKGILHSPGGYQLLAAHDTAETVESL